MGTASEKRAAFEKLLEAGKTMVHLDARRWGVDVPKRLRTEVHLRLDFSLRFHLDVFEVTDRGITASLSFSGTNHLCKIPWTAIFGLFSHATREFLLWPEDAPTELLPTGRDPEVDEAEAAPRAEEEPEVGPAVRKVGHLRVIK